MNPLVSIIVPVYNGESFLAETIQTVLDQTYANWELLLIDDGSKDSSASICKLYEEKDTRINYLYKENGGQASARNLGITKSKGEWIALLDADDLWSKKKLELQIKCIEQHPEITICYTNTSAFKEMVDNEIDNNDRYDYGLMPSNQLFPIVFRHNHISNSSVLFKKQPLLENGLYDENETLRGSEDWDLLLRLLDKQTYVFGLAEKLLYYRLHDGGIHNQSARMLLGKTIVYLKYDNHEKLPRLLKTRQFRYVFRELMNVLWDNRKTNALREQFYIFAKKDKFGWATIIQRILVKIVPLKVFMWLSQKLIYRIAYRIEKLIYWMFLN